MPKTMPRRPSVRATSRALSYALTQARPEPPSQMDGEGRAAMLQWETDVFAVSLVLEQLEVCSADRFRHECQGPKDTGGDDAA